MNRLETQISEKIFLNRLIAMCTMQKSRIKSLKIKNTFLLKLDENDFRIGFNKNFASCCLYGKYEVRDDKKVTVSYRFSFGAVLNPKVKKLITEHLEKICLIDIMI